MTYLTPRKNNNNYKPTVIVYLETGVVTEYGGSDAFRDSNIKIISNG